jgi:hypothetical protein
MNPESMPFRRAKAQCTGRCRSAVTQGLKRKAQADAAAPFRKANARVNVANSNRRKQDPAAIGNNK